MELFVLFSLPEESMFMAAIGSSSTTITDFPTRVSYSPRTAWSICQTSCHLIPLGPSSYFRVWLICGRPQPRGQRSIPVLLFHLC